jgi:sugar/nucleoside kinase (ribokinase family)
VITDGADKLLVQDTDNRTIIAIPPTTVTGNVNGAGDALAGATTADWVQGKPLAASVFETGLPAAQSVLQGNRINPAS